ncbi:MAG: hypothetical protein Kow0062_07280 [Acidobacteriota bacterium]
MPRREPLLLALQIALLAPGLADGPPAAGCVVDHRLVVTLDPEAHRLEARDTLSWSASCAAAGLPVALHAGLSPRVETDGWTLAAAAGGADADGPADGVPLERFVLRGPDGAHGPVTLAWGGVIDHPLERMGREYQRGFSETPGTIGTDGVYLAQSTAWYPVVDGARVTFEVEVGGLAAPYDVVSSGARVRHETGPDGARTVAWRADAPLEEIHLVGGPLVEYEDRHGDTVLYVFLRERDDALARRYLTAVARYLTMYERVLPPYPFPAFSVVENFWETGYGMPGFTLLGSRVMRFPFILTSSVPHEVLHNWWGNSVFVAPDSGNWCEGLTAYMADHVFAEHKGEDALYRRATLKKFTDFVRGEKDFPLREFTARHSASSEAVGYGKSLMLFHMVRRGLGDEAFLAALRGVAERYRFRRARFDDLAEAFAAEGGAEWRPFIEAWVDRPGAPTIVLEKAEPLRDGQGHALRLVLHQKGVDAPFPLRVPVLVTLEGGAGPHVEEIDLGAGRAEVTIPLPARPLRVDVDPLFDVMRRLDPLEIPPALSTALGADAPLFVLPADAPESERAAWLALARAWAAPGEPRLADDAALDALPDGPVLVLGAGNRFGPRVAAALAAHDVALADGALRIVDRTFERTGRSFVLVARHPADPEQALCWIAADPVGAIPGLARKLPHYTKYSWLAFEGDEPTNVGKGQWQPLSSPLVRQLGDRRIERARPPHRAPLIELPPAWDARALLETVRTLSAPEMEGRGLGTDGLARATEWVERTMASIGLRPLEGDSLRQEWTQTEGVPRPMTLTNLVGVVPGATHSPALPPVLLMAHLDHLGRGWPDVRAGNEGRVHPGADDNASGVAVVLEIARALAAEPPRPRPVIVAIVTGEEAGRLGSRHLLARLADSGRRPAACVNLDTVGRLGKRPLTVIGAETAREWRFLFMGIGYTTGLKFEFAREPLDSSDQVSCHEAGVPAVQLFSGAHEDYHRPTDTADRIDAAGLARVAEATWEAVTYLAERREPLTSAPGVREGEAAGPAPRAERRAALGTVPDFGFAGPGVRVEDVVSGSAAEQAGIRPGDVLVAIDGEAVTDLRTYAKLLARHAPGDRVRLTIERDGTRQELEATLTAR